MVTITKTTKSLKIKDIKRNWHLIDLKGKILGRVATEIAVFLQGKHKRDNVPYIDCGDFVVAINCAKVKVSGKKTISKKYTKYTGYPGGLKIKKYNELIIKDPKYIIRHAVLGMLPNNKLRKKRIARLYIFKDEKHNLESKFSN